MTVPLPTPNKRAPAMALPAWVVLVSAYALAAILGAALSGSLPGEGRLGLEVRNATPSAVLGKRDFVATPLFTRSEDGRRVVRQSEATHVWARLGAVGPTGRTLAALEFPYRAVIRCGSLGGGLALEIVLAADGPQVQGLLLDSEQPADNGGFTRSGQTPVLQLPDARLSTLCADPGHARIEIVVDRHRQQVSCGGEPIVLNQSLQGRPAFRVMNALETRVSAIDGIVLQGLGGDGGGGRRFEADFRTWPLLAGAQRWPGRGVLGLPSIVLVVSLLLCLAMDLAGLSLVRRTPSLTRSGGPLLLAWIPLQVAMIVAVAHCLGVARPVPIAVSALLLLVKLPMAGFHPAQPTCVAPRPRAVLRLGAAALLLAYGGLALRFELNWFEDFSSVATPLAVLAPLGVLATIWLRGGRADAVLAGLAAGQLGLFPLVWYFAPMSHPWCWASVVLFAWLAASARMASAAEARPARWRAPAARIAIAAVALCLVEVGLRADYLSDYGLRSLTTAGDAETSLVQYVRASWARAPGEAPLPWENPPGRIHPHEKHADALRILCLGSSTTFGVGTESPASDSYPVQLEVSLQRGMQREVEVVNAGIPGVTLDGLFVLARDVLMPMDPDLVVLYFGNNGERAESLAYLSDLEAKVRRHPRLRTPEQLAAAADLRWSPPWLVSTYLIADDLRLFRLAWGSARRLREAADPPTPQNPSGTVASEIVSLCEARQVPLLLVSEYVRGDLFGGSESHPYHGIFARLSETSPPVVYHMDPRARIPRQELESHFVDSVHMDRQGYGRLAEAIAGYLEDEGLVPRPPTEGR